MSRVCAVCAEDGRKSSMANGVRHLHELTPGDHFKFEEQDEVYVLEGVTRARAEINFPDDSPERIRTSFTTDKGVDVSFFAGGRSSRRKCSPGAQVVPVQPEQGGAPTLNRKNTQHGPHTKEFSMAGVTQSSEGWQWECPDCQEKSVPELSRDKAREAYKIHRKETCSARGSSTQSQENPMSEATKPPKPVKEKKVKPVKEPKPVKEKKVKPVKEPKPVKEKKVKEKRADGKTDVTWRIAKVKNPKTERDIVLIEIKKDGTLTAPGQKRTGLEFVTSWVEIRAASRREAIEKLAKGEGEKKSRGK